MLLLSSFQHFLVIKYFLIKVYILLFRHCDIAHLIDYSILLYALGNKKIHVTHFIKAFALCGGLELKPQDLRAKLVFKKDSETANSVYHWTVSYTENLLFINEKSEELVKVRCCVQDTAHPKMQESKTPLELSLVHGLCLFSVPELGERQLTSTS